MKRAWTLEDATREEERMVKRAGKLLAKEHKLAQTIKDLEAKLEDARSARSEATKELDEERRLMRLAFVRCADCSCFLYGSQGVMIHGDVFCVVDPATGDPTGEHRCPTCQRVARNDPAKRATAIHKDYL